MFGRGKGNANVYSGPVAVWARRGPGGGRSHVMRVCAPRVQGQGETVAVSVWVCACVVCVCAAPRSLSICVEDRRRPYTKAAGGPPPPRPASKREFKSALT